MALVTEGAITAIREHFTTAIQEQIAMREKSTRKDKERVFGEMMIYEDALRIMNRVLNYVYYNS